MRRQLDLVTGRSGGRIDSPASDCASSESRLGRRAKQDVGEVEQAAPSGDRCVARNDAVGAADHLVERAEAQARHDGAELLGDEEEEVDDVLGRALEARAEHRVLRRDARRGTC